jgi:hypothetical protein
MNKGAYRWDTSLICKSFETSGAIHTLPGHVFKSFPANGDMGLQRHSDVDRRILLDQISSHVNNKTMMSQNLRLLVYGTCEFTAHPKARTNNKD